MSALYTKTALKKIGKDELVKMFLDKQAKEINYSMDDEIEKLKEENKKLKEENEKLKGEIDEIEDWWNDRLDERIAELNKIWEDRRAVLLKEKDHLQKQRDDLQSGIKMWLKGLKMLEKLVDV